MKLRTKFFLVFSILATVSLLILTAFSYQRYTQTIFQRMDDISTRLFENAQQTANNTLGDIQRIATSLNIYYNDGTSIIQKLKRYNDDRNIPSTYEFYKDSQLYERTCQSLLYQNSDIYGIYILTPSGFVFANSNGPNGTVLNSYDFEQADWYQDTIALDGGFYVSMLDKHEFFSGDKSTVFFSQYLKDVYSHDALGVLLIDCNPEIFDISAINSMPDITLLTIDNTKTDDVLYTN